MSYDIDDGFTELMSNRRQLQLLQDQLYEIQAYGTENVIASDAPIIGKIRIKDNTPSGGGLLIVNSIKDPVRVATTANLSDVNPVSVIIDGVTTVEGDRVLVKDQTAPSGNGIYVIGPVSGGLTSLTRATDFGASTDIEGSMIVAVQEGTASGDKLFMLTTNEPITLNTTSLVFVEVSGGGSGIAFPIDFPVEQRGDVGASTQVIDFAQSNRHAVVMRMTGDIGLSLINTTVNKLQITSIKLKQDATGGRAFTGFTQTVENEQTIIDAVNDFNNPNQFVVFIVRFLDGLFTAFLEDSNVVSGSEITDGTIENQHLEWNNSTSVWDAQIDLTFGATGPFADDGFLKFANDSIIFAARTGADDGNVELKITTQDEFDFTTSNNGNVVLLLRAQHPTNPDNLYLIQQNPGTGADAFHTFPNDMFFTSGVTTVMRMELAQVTTQTILPILTGIGGDEIGLAGTRWFRANVDNIVLGGAGTGIGSIGELLFIDNLATPAAALAIFSDGTDLFANTGGSTVNLSDIGSSGEFFGPWTATHDAGNQLLDSLSRINQEGTVPTSGFINMANSATLAWEASPAGADGTLTFSSNERFVFSNNPIVGTTSGGLTLGVSGNRIGTLFVNAIDAASSLVVQGNSILNGDNSFGNQDSDIHTFRGEIDIQDIAIPATPASGRLTLFVDSADGITKVKKSSGAVVSLEGGAGGVTELSDLTDVNTAGVSVGNFLRFTGSLWVDSSIQSGDLPSTISGTHTFTGNVFFSEDVTLGNTGADSIFFNGELATSIIPELDIIDLGDSSNQFRDIYLKVGLGSSQLFFDGGGDTFLTGSDSTGRINVFCDNVNTISFLPTSLLLSNGTNISLGILTGTKIGTLPTHKLAFYGSTPIVQPPAPAQNSAAIITTLQALGLVA